jgi:hypothetical protein
LIARRSRDPVVPRAARRGGKRSQRKRRRSGSSGAQTGVSPPLSAENPSF